MKTLIAILCIIISTAVCNGALTKGEDKDPTSVITPVNHDATPIYYRSYSTEEQKVVPISGEMRLKMNALDAKVKKLFESRPIIMTNLYYRILEIKPSLDKTTDEYILIEVIEKRLDRLIVK